MEANFKLIIILSLIITLTTIWANPFETNILHQQPPPLLPPPPHPGVVSITDQVGHVVFDVIKDFRHFLLKEMRSNRFKENCSLTNPSLTDPVRLLANENAAFGFSFKEDCVAFTIAGQPIHQRCGYRHLEPLTMSANENHLRPVTHPLQRNPMENFERFPDFPLYNEDPYFVNPFLQRPIPPPNFMAWQVPPLDEKIPPWKNHLYNYNNNNIGHKFMLKDFRRLIFPFPPSSRNVPQVPVLVALPHQQLEKEHRSESTIAHHQFPQFSFK